MSYPAAQKQDHPHDKPAEPKPENLNGARPIGAGSLTTLPEKRPSRRFFGLLPGRRDS